MRLAVEGAQPLLALQGLGHFSPSSPSSTSDLSFNLLSEKARRTSKGRRRKKRLSLSFLWGERTHHSLRRQRFHGLPAPKRSMGHCPAPVCFGMCVTGTEASHLELRHACFLPPTARTHSPHAQGRAHDSLWEKRSDSPACVA